MEPLTLPDPHRRWPGVKPAVSFAMSQVHQKDTKPEMVVRRLAHALGYRFRLHRKNLPGTPDLVFPRRRKAILVHGCFWHGHDCARGQRLPKANTNYWVAKIGRNIVRDAAVVEALKAADWQVLTVWECETGVAGRAQLTARIADFLK